jgi:NAD(P)H-binding
MGCSFSAKDGDVFTQRTANKSVVDFTSHSTDKVVVIMDKNSNSISGSQDKIKVMKPSKILLIGDNRIKVATACYLKSLISMTNQNIEIVVGTRDPDHARNAALVNAGVRLLKADMSVPATLLPAIRQSGADVVLICSPSQKDKSTQTISGVSACKRAGVGHIVVLSQTCVERDAPSIFGDRIIRCVISYKLHDRAAADSHG